MTSSQPTTETWAGARRVGYTIAIGINALFLYVVQNLLEWDIFPWLTDAWEEVVPIISASLVVGMIVNFLYLWYDDRWFKAATQVLASAVSLVATVQVLRVFPFDFTGYEFDWAILMRLVLIVTIIGISIAIVADVVKFFRAVSARAA